MKLKLTIAALFLSLTLVPAYAQHYVQTNLVSDVPGLANFTDPDLVNSWGLSRSSTSFWWAADNGTGKSTLYNTAGVKQGLVVTIEAPQGSSEPATPTGTVFNTSTGFPVSNGTTSAAARFLFVTEDGTIAGWNPAIAATTALIAVDNSSHGAIYKGMTLAQIGSATFLYAANFGQGRVDVYDSNWQPYSTTGGFVDAGLPVGYAPFNVQSVGNDVYVTFAKVGDLPDEVDGRGLGYVDKFDSDGRLLMRFEHGPWLDAPWGIALAPAGFGKLSNRLLVGIFGSGRIAAYDTTSGEFVGFLHGPRGPLVIDGLWAIYFGNSGNNGNPTTLFFAAGPNDEQHGLFGTLTAAPDKDGGDDDN